MYEYDIVIVGAGAVGSAVAKLLSEYELKLAVIEKEADVAFGISGRNSGVVHAGFNNLPGSLKARLCLKGSRGFEALAEELGISYKKTGKLVTGFSDRDREKLEELKQRGEQNGVKGLEIIDSRRIKMINADIEGNFALWSAESAVFEPFEYTIALAEQAAANQADFFFNSRVVNIRKNEEGLFLLEIENAEGENNSVVKGRILINCAGLFSSQICEMLGVDRYEIIPCRGEYHILDKAAASVVNLPVYPIPDEEKGVLGVHLTPTTSGNLMIGPSSEFIEDKEDFSNDERVMNMLKQGAEALMPKLKNFPVIRSFSGIRPKLIDKMGEASGDFVIEEDERNPGFIYLVGIESPGITASMPIAEYVFGLVKNSLGYEPIKKSLVVSRKAFFEEGFRAAGAEEKAEDRYMGTYKMVCRCEKVSERDILKAYDDIIRLGAIPTIKGIKNRCGAFRGGCQGCFCTIDATELLRRYRGVSLSELTYDGVGSEMFMGSLK